jgi:hypothetical protein
MSHLRALKGLKSLSIYPLNKEFDLDGSMPELSLNEIGQVLDFSIKKDCFPALKSLRLTIDVNP